MTHRHRVSRSALLLLIALPLVVPLSGCGKRTIEKLRESSSDINLVLVTIDSLRKGHLEPYGYESLALPAMTDLADKGIVFKDAVTASPVNVPSHASILTGLYPPHHGLRHTGTQILPERNETLAEILRNAGFATGAFVGTCLLDASSGLAQGFGTYDDRFLNAQGQPVEQATERQASAVTDSALQFIRREADGRFFAWINYADPRYPYVAGERFSYQSQNAMNFHRRYDAEIAFVDAEIGRLLARLSDWGIAEKTVVAVVGAHGESFGPDDKNEPYHGIYLYEPTVSVPFILSGPSVLPSGVEVTDLVSTVDVMPTLLDVVSLLTPAIGRDGKSQLQAAFGVQGAADPDRAVYIETLHPLVEYGWSSLYSMRTSRYKLIGAPEPELYDLLADPGETKNLCDVQEGLALQLYEKMKDLVGEEALAPPQDPEAEMVLTEIARDRLAALGYTGEFPVLDEEVLLHDPKRRILLAEALIEAERQLVDGDKERMEQVLNFVLGIPDSTGRVLTRLGDILHRKGDLAAAREALERAVAAEPTLARGRFELARVLAALDLGREALDQIEKAVELAPRASWIQTERGNVLARLYRPSEAETAYRAAVELDPLCLSALAGLARLLEDGDRVDESLETWRSVLRNRPIDPEALMGQGRVLERMGEVEAALRSYGYAFQVSRIARDRIALLEELAEALDRLDKPLSVLQLLVEISESRPADADLHFRIADLHLELGQMDLALQRLDTLLARDPESVEALIKKARFLTLAARSDEAETEIEKALALDHTHAEALVVKGILARKRGDSGGALELFEKASRTDGSGEAFNQMARLLLTSEDGKGDFARAVDLSHKAVEANPDQPEFVDTHARALFRSGDVEGATSACTSFLEQHPRTATLLLTLAELHADAGNASEAAASYRSAAEVYRDQKRLKRAVEVMDQALAAQPENADLLAMREQLEQDRQSRQDEKNRPATTKAPGKGGKKKGGKKAQGETAN